VSRLRVLQLPRPWMIVLDVVAWAAWSATAGLVAHRMPVSRLGHDKWWFHLRPAERSGRLYERLRIKRWKDALPEAGALFRGGFSKRRVTRHDREYLERFVIETRRAELAHWPILAIGPTFFLWMPWWLALAMLGYAVIANVPCILVQRYNRARLERMLGRLSS
jgi:glycosyl-4,4'-diaponeurosporenoate acyltransferase